MAKRWVIAGGGTGGHVTPALALGEALRERGDEILFVGSARGLESRLVPDAGFDLEVLPSEQFMGRNLLGRVRGALSILRSVGKAVRVLRRFDARAVISVGGYAAMPVAIAARLTNRPLFLVEPNAIPGRVNRLSASFARDVFVGFESTRGHLSDRTESVCVGVPLRQALYRAFTKRGEKGVPSTPLRVFVFGGSQGAHQLNENVPEALSRLRKKSVEVFHQTGEADRAAVIERYADLELPAEVVAFEHDMPKRYEWADLVICRAGALTVAELALAGMPALLVPYPFAADDHQTANARALEEAGAARCLDPRPLDRNVLAQAVAELVTTPGRLLLMREAAGRLARPNAARDIIEYCAARLEGRSPQIDSLPDGEEGDSCNAS
ncbi:MAG: undecaprenyldiphospho-muramoylpentapeptide beta-N-acetylglucosaminyltransferase [bacterium]|nr:undecaprenyldiphospho-muramoylpentapeptide beta-N-acetylglucosaminyltransferase [Deltaproteobacteria bacterium]MCP4907223.1 undecaprenyldiphospho-muramoylpentapeptide beta-N-acetylglucosaminyltransferase [bacterium]